MVLGTYALPTHGDLEIATGREYLQCRNLEHPDRTDDEMLMHLADQPHVFGMLVHVFVAVLLEMI